MNNMEQLGTLKMLLGIKDDEQDSLLSFLIEDTVNMIMAIVILMYCHVSLKALFRRLRRICTGRKGTGTVKVPK